MALECLLKKSIILIAKPLKVIPMDASVPEVIEMRGWLKYKHVGNKLWFKRYCVIREHVLIIYKDETQTETEQIINLTTNTKVEKVETARFPRFSVQNYPSQYLLFVANTVEDIERWITAFKNSLETSPILTMNSFDIISVIGRGYFGKVMLVRHKVSGELFAIKSIHKKRLKEEKKSHTVIAERNILMKTCHPFIVRLCFAFQTSSKFYLGLEYAAGGEMFYHMERRGCFPPSEVRLYVAEIALALDHLHRLGIVYRDLKPENVMLDSEGHIKLTDFGLSKDILISNKTETLCGTTEYLSPEMVLRAPYSYEVDWWSLGVLMYEMLTEVTPWASSNRSVMLTDIVHSPPRFPPYVPPDAVDLICALLMKDPKQRPTFDQLKKFPFFDGLDWDRVYRRDYVPEFVPEMPDATKPHNFDSEFTTEMPIDSLQQDGSVTIPGFSMTLLTPAAPEEPFDY